MKVLVTGGAGFIGAHVASQLLEDGAEVAILDNLVTGFRELIPEGASFVEGDLSDSNLLNKVLQGCDAVIHMAASSIVPDSVADPLKYFENNLTNSLNLLEAVRAQKVPRFVFSSTAAVYGEPESVPIKESDPLLPSSPYGASKLGFENYLQAYTASFGLKAVSLRYFNAYGPGELHEPETHAVPNFVEAALKKKPLTVYGDGRMIRDYVYVEDIARAHLDVLDLDASYDVFNIGDGAGTSVSTLVKEVFAAVGRETEVVYEPPRPGDPEKLISDIAKIKKEVGWTPKVGLRQGLRRTAEWYAGRT